MVRALGLDFGTTNTVLVSADDKRPVEPVTVSFHNKHLEAIRTALCFYATGIGENTLLQVDAGPYAIQRYLEEPEDSRFLQSFKTFAGSRTFQGTYVFGTRLQFDDLMEIFVQKLLSHTNLDPKNLPERLIVGRPVSFAGNNSDEKLAIARYRNALQGVGISELLFVFEPVAAAFYFVSELTNISNILVADFGGGTSDFSIIRCVPTVHGPHFTPLGQSGLGVAGDSFDYRIVDNLILPKFGKGGMYQSMGKQLEIPASYYESFARWNLLSLFRSTKDFAEFKRFSRNCLDSEKVNLAIKFIETGSGFRLYEAVSKLKENLSSTDEASFDFTPIGLNHFETVPRSDFEEWIALDIEKMEKALHATLHKIQLDCSDIDRVFLTGGTSFVPAVRRIFEHNFGPEKIEMGNELFSVAHGLGIIGKREDALDWSVREDNSA